MAVKKVAVKKSASIKYPKTKAVKWPSMNAKDYPGTAGTNKYKKQVAKASKNSTSNKTRDTKPGMTKNGPRRRAI